MQQFEIKAKKSVNSTEYSMYSIKDGRVEFVIDNDGSLHITGFERNERDEYGFKLPKGLEGSRVHECSLTQLKFTREQALQLKEWINENIH